MEETATCLIFRTGNCAHKQNRPGRESLPSASAKSEPSAWSGWIPSAQESERYCFGGKGSSVPCASASSHAYHMSTDSVGALAINRVVTASLNWQLRGHNIQMSITMSAQKGKGSVRKSKQMTVKTSLNNPYTLQWNTLDGESMHFILESLEEVMKRLAFKKVAFRRRKKPCSGQKEKEEPTRVQVSKGQDTKKAEDNKVHGWTSLHVKSQLAIGINEVTRALEKDELQLVLVCKSAKPAMLTSHLIPLSASRAILAGQVPRLSERLAPVLGLTSVLALGFKRNADAFGEVAKLIAPRLPKLELPWIDPVTQQNPVSEEDLERTGLPTVELPESSPEGGSPSQKRKRTGNSKLTSPGNTILQVLKVKKIVRNPNKKRKPPKTKKRLSK